MAIKNTADAFTKPHMTEFRFDVADMEGRVVNGELSLKMPALLLRASPINKDVEQDFIDAGFTLREVEDAVQKMVNDLQALQIGKELQKRRR